MLKLGDGRLKVWQESLLLCLIALVPALCSAWLHPKKPSWDPATVHRGEIDLAIVLQWKNIIWVDARSEKEYQKEHIPDAILLNEDDWDRLIVPLLQSWQPDMPIVVYCDDRQCRASHYVAKRLREEVGLKPVYVLRGGWEAWHSATRSKN